MIDLHLCYTARPPASVTVDKTVFNSRDRYDKFKSLIDTGPDGQKCGALEYITNLRVVHWIESRPRIKQTKIL